MFFEVMSKKRAVRINSLKLPPENSSLRGLFILMKIQIKPVYYCGFCTKHGLSKYAMEKHEKICYGNPENKIACSGCAHCVEQTKEIYYEDMHDGREYRPANTFLCTKLNQRMYHFKAVKKDLINRFPETFEGEIQMPKECEHFEVIF